MQIEHLPEWVTSALEDRKALNIVTIDVRGKTSITDFMVIASGTSDRHVKAIADHLVQTAKSRGEPPLGVEGERQGQWILVDLVDAVVHVMLPEVRDFYALEKLWDVDAPTAGE